MKSFNFKYWSANHSFVSYDFKASLKASFEAINLGVQTHEFRIGQEIAGAAQVRLRS